MEEKSIDDYLLDFYKMSTDQQNIINGIVTSYKKVVGERDALRIEVANLKKKEQE